MVRDPTTADLPAGIEVVRGDLTEPAGLGVALEGADAVFLLWPFFSADGAPAVVEAIARTRRGWSISRPRLPPMIRSPSGA